MNEAVEKLMGLARQVVETRQLIDWRTLDAKTIQEWLEICPELWSVIRWDRLPRDTWFVLLKANSAPARRCPWLATFSGNEWVELLYDCPRLSDYCDWSKLNDMDWSNLLAEYPDFSKHRPKGALTGTALASVLRKHPDFVAEDCDWSSLSGEDWAELLSEDESLAEHCDWSVLEGANWAELLIHTDSFDGECNWSKLTEKDWQKVLRFRPELKQEHRAERR
jgi:hypothetical protein